MRASESRSRNLSRERIFWMLLTSLPSLPDRNLPFGVELRLDRFANIDLSSLQQFWIQFQGPTLLTFRSQKGKEDLLQEILSLVPPFFDLEIDLDPSFLQKTLSQFPQTRFILSSHAPKTFAEVVEVYEKMKTFPAFAYKIAWTPSSTIEAIESVLFAKKHPSLCLICMGKRFAFTRILNAIFQSPLNYASFSEKEALAPGQIPLSDWIDLYDFPSLNPETKIYALIGHPVEQSIGHIYHNSRFRQEKKNALYLKIDLFEEELPFFFSLAPLLNIEGLSITTPFKEKAFSFAKETTIPLIQAINTLRFNAKEWIGCHTDGAAALDAIEERMGIANKRMVILGAGGTAAAIAFEAAQRGFFVFIVNRTEKKGQNLALRLGCSYGMPDRFDCIVNATGDLDPLPELSFERAFLALECRYVPDETPFLRRAKEKGCSVIYGKELFTRQAEKQQFFWKKTWPKSS